VRTAGERSAPAAVGLAACLSALFFANGLSDAPLVWIGAVALVGAAAALFVAAPAGRAALVYLGCLWGLALWCGLTLLWSASPDQSWSFTNRTLVYAAFAVLGVLAGPLDDAVVAVATAVVTAVCGWALLAKLVPGLYTDYGRLARLRAPLEDWNMLALVCVAGVPLALWTAARRRVPGTLLLYLFSVTLLLTYSRFGVVLACASALAWLVLEREHRVEALGTLVAAGGVAAGVFGVALTLNGITSDGQTRAVRAHDGWVFLLVLLGGAALVAGAAALVARVRVAPDHRRAVERAAAVAAIVLALAGLAVTFAKANTIWHEFTNPVAGQVANTSGRFGHLGSGNRWTWWHEAWTGFTHHPLGGTGGGTFGFTDYRYRRSSDVHALEPHNTPLQFLSETGVVGFLLLLGALGAALARVRGPLGIAFAAFVAHTVVNYDWSFVGITGPFLLVGGVLVSAPRRGAAVRRPLLAAAAVVFALGCVYSLAAPWLADRAEATLHFDRAHTYNPLSTRILTEQAAFARTPARAERYYRDAVALEPTNAELWYELAQFYADNGRWVFAYRALSKAYTYDPYGLAGRCNGLAAEIRRRVGAPSSCRAGG
jgi:hypothetical protein